jgi:hypothetical protein
VVEAFRILPKGDCDPAEFHQWELFFLEGSYGISKEEWLEDYY